MCDADPIEEYRVAFRARNGYDPTIEKRAGGAPVKSRRNECAHCGRERED